MDYFQTLVDHIATCISYAKTICLNILISSLIWYALTNDFPTIRRINQFLWKRGTDAEEREEQLEWQRRTHLLQEWSRQEPAETLRRQIRSREMVEDNIAQLLTQQKALELLSQKLAKKKDEEDKLRIKQEKLSRKIARKREEQEELRYELERLFHNPETTAVFRRQSSEDRLNDEELQRYKKILARGNESRTALEEERRKAIKNEKTVAIEEMRQLVELEHKWNEIDWEGPRFEPSDIEQTMVVELDSVTVV
ncbi:Leucine-rich repeat and IQ domain-containing protein 1 [Pseudocyphellaria aurata]|nr:Leucine-rich repeat and IQ domain-containing protein 1 [Pseudocyphellaria aurata]